MNVRDVRLAAELLKKAGKEGTSRKEVFAYASAVNAKPLPSFGAVTQLRLPPEEYRLLQHNVAIAAEEPKEGPLPAGSEETKESAEPMDVERDPPPAASAAPKPGRGKQIQISLDPSTLGDSFGAT